MWKIAKEFFDSKVKIHPKVSPPENDYFFLNETEIAKTLITLAKKATTEMTKSRFKAPRDLRFTRRFEGVNTHEKLRL